jgi:hypothetical protein
MHAGRPQLQRSAPTSLNASSFLSEEGTWRCGAAQPIVDRLTKSRFGHRLDGDGMYAQHVEGLQMGEEILCGFAQIAFRGQVENGDSMIDPLNATSSKGQQRFALFNNLRIQPDARAGGIVRLHLTRRFDASTDVTQKRLPNHFLDPFRRHAARAKQPNSIPLNLYDGRLKANRRTSPIYDQVDALPDVVTHCFGACPADATR